MVRTGSPETDPHEYSELVFNKGANALQQRKDSLSNKSVLGHSTPIKHWAMHYKDHIWNIMANSEQVAIYERQWQAFK